MRRDKRASNLSGIASNNHQLIGTDRIAANHEAGLAHQTVWPAGSRSLHSVWVVSSLRISFYAKCHCRVDAHVCRALLFGAYGGAAQIHGMVVVADHVVVQERVQHAPCTLRVEVM